MKIIVKRRLETYSGMLKLKMRVNGEYIGKIANGEEKEVTIPEENATQQIKQLNGKSNKLTVNEDDIVEVSVGHSTIWIFLLAIILMTLTGSYEGTSWILGLILSIILIIGANMIIETFKITKVNRERLD